MLDALPPPPPRLATRALCVSFATVVLVLGAVFGVLTFEVRARTREAVTANLDVREVADLARADAALLVNGTVRASTLPRETAAALTARASAGPLGTTESLAGATYVVRTAFTRAPATVLTAGSVDVAAAKATRAAFTSLAVIGVGALLLGAAASLWLARTLTRPIGRLSQALVNIGAGRHFDRRLPPCGTSRELDALTLTFNEVMRALATAEAEATYLGAVRALIAALDARDPYTAGHSERVSVLSVAMGRQLAMAPEEIEVLRLGALLHDIGTIGVPDHVLRKPDLLSPEEFDCIRTHPSTGTQILQSVPFLARYIPVVELHHERPDGRGYPYGLSGPNIPLAARIVHVADACDAMTSARAYRAGRPWHEAVRELERCAGTEFDPEAVGALVAAVQEGVLHGAGGLALAG